MLWLVQVGISSHGITFRFLPTLGTEHPPTTRTYVQDMKSVWVQDHEGYPYAKRTNGHTVYQSQ